MPKVEQNLPVLDRFRQIVEDLESECEAFCPPCPWIFSLAESSPISMRRLRSLRLSWPARKTDTTNMTNSMPQCLQSNIIKQYGQHHLIVYG